MKIFNSNAMNNDQYFISKDLLPDLRKHAIRGGGATVFAQIFTFCIEMIGTIVLARILTPDDFGLVAMVVTILWLFMILRNLGLIDATIQSKEINHKQISTLFWVTVVFGIVLTVIFIAIAPLIAWFYKKPQLTAIAFELSFVFLFEGFSTQHQALLKRNMKFYTNSTNDIIAVTISVIISILLALQGWGFRALIVKRLVLSLSTSIGVWMFCKWRPGLPSFGTEAWSMLKFGINIIINSTFNYFQKYFDKILIGRYLGTHSLAFYDKGYQLFMAPSQQMSIPLTHVAIATLSKLRVDPDKYRHYYLNAVSMLSFIGMPIGAYFTIMGRDIILLLLGPQWGKAAEIFSIFGIGIGTQMLYSTSNWLHISLGRTDRLFRWGIIGVVVYIISFVFGISFGATGVAIAYIIALHVLLAPGLWYAGKPINLNLYLILSATWKYYLSAIIAGLFCWFFLFSFDMSANTFIAFSIFERLLSSFVLYVSTYLLLIIAFHQSIKPISQCISVLFDTIPRLRILKSI